MLEKMLDMHNWIKRKSQDKIDTWDGEFSKPFGFITMKDGRKAQIIVTLQLDEDDWI